MLRDWLETLTGWQKLVESMNRLQLDNQYLLNNDWAREIELILIYIYLLNFKSHHCLMFAISCKCQFIYHPTNTIKYLLKMDI